jgi:hypothetical protein
MSVRRIGRFNLFVAASSRVLLWGEIMAEGGGASKKKG